MRFLIYFCLFSFLLISCNSNSPSQIDNGSDTTDQITNEHLLGDWKLARWTVQDESDNVENDMTLMDLKIWSFSKDSIVVTCYPQYLFNQRPFKIKGDTLYYSWDRDSDYEEKYTLEFKGDTLLMTTVAKIVMTNNSSAPATVYTTFRNYLVRMEVDQDTLKNLRYKLVDWSYYQKKWTYHSSQTIDPFDVPMTDSISVPAIIDLTFENNANYSFEKTDLKYFDPKSKQFYYLSFRGHGYTNHKLSKLILGTYNSDSTQQISLRYEEIK